MLSVRCVQVNYLGKHNESHVLQEHVPALPNHELAMALLAAKATVRAEINENLIFAGGVRKGAFLWCLWR